MDTRKDLEEIIHAEQVSVLRRAAQIRHVEELLDELDAAIAEGDFDKAQKCTNDVVAAYAAVKQTSGLEEARNLVLGDLVLNLCELQNGKKVN